MLWRVRLTGSRFTPGRLFLGPSRWPGWAVYAPGVGGSMDFSDADNSGLLALLT